MFGIGGFELFIILVFGFLIFGPDKLPEIAKTVGRGIARFREAQKEVNEAIGDEKIIDLNNPDEPFKNPVEALDRIAKRQEEKKAASAKAGAGGASGAAGASGAFGATPASATRDGADASEGGGRQESFTERKARYERERAARKAAEAEAGAAKAEPASEKPSADAFAPAGGGVAADTAAASEGGDA